MLLRLKNKFLYFRMESFSCWIGFVVIHFKFLGPENSIYQQMISHITFLEPISSRTKSLGFKASSVDETGIDIKEQETFTSQAAG